MLVYITPVLTAIALALVLGAVFAKDEKHRRAIKLAAKIAGGVLGIIFVIMVIGFISVFIRLNF